MNKTEYELLTTLTDLKEIPADGAFNLRLNGAGVERRCSDNIQILPKTDKPGIDIIVKPGTKNETVYIPVMIDHEGVSDMVYNDFEIGEGADVVIVAGCGIHNDGCTDSQHDGIHTFHLQKGARIKYVEKHYGAGKGLGGRVLNPTTVVNMEEDSYCEMETSQIKGVDSTMRNTVANLGARAKLVVTEKLMTHGGQAAHSDMTVNLNGEDAAVQIISRSVAKDGSVQVFHPRAVGNCPCRAHVQCDSIIMDKARISSIPEITANHADAQIVHEAAIGRINSDQLIKLQTFGLTEGEAEEVIVQGFLK